jgi:hypothetical protein
MPTALLLLEILTVATRCLKAHHDRADSGLRHVPTMPSRCNVFLYSPRKLNHALPITFIGKEEKNVSFQEYKYRPKGKTVPLTPFARDPFFEKWKVVHLDKKSRTFFYI